MTTKPHLQPDDHMDWIGRLPPGWRRLRLKYVTDFVNGAAFKPEEWGDTGTPIIRIENLNGSEDFNCTERRLPEKYVVSEGDLLFGWSGNIGTSFGPFWWTRSGRYYLNQHIFRVVRFSVYKRWLYWTLRAVTFEVETRVHGIIGLVHVTRPELDNTVVPVPADRCTQRFIADFLDRKTASIDALIEKQEQLLALLAEKRQALITQAVTKGLDPNVPMKDSGSDVLPSIPQGWSLIPLRYLLSFGPRNGISPPPATADGALSFSISAVRDGKVSIEGNEKFVELDHATARSYWLAPGDILLMRGNGNLSLVGTCGLVEHVPAECTYPDILMRMRVGRRLLAEFLVAAINSPYVRGQVETLAKTANGTFKVSREDVRTLQVAVPPLDEQERIVAHVQSELDRLDALSQRIQTMIDKLREYRQALITAAVTGQLDVTPTIHSERRPSPQAEAV